VDALEAELDALKQNEPYGQDVTSTGDVFVRNVPFGPPHFNSRRSEQMES